MSKTLALAPRMSEKSYGVSQTGVYVFDVPKDANKHTVARAVSAQYSVTVTDVRTVVVKGKTKRTVRKTGRAVTGRQANFKKAYVTLKEGDTLPLFAAIEEEEQKTEKTQAKFDKVAEKQAKKEAKKSDKKESK